MQELLQVWAQFLLENSVSAQGVDSGCSVMSPFRDPVELCFSLFCAAHGGDVLWPCPPRGRSNNAEAVLPGSGLPACGGDVGTEGVVLSLPCFLRGCGNHCWDALGS